LDKSGKNTKTVEGQQLKVICFELSSLWIFFSEIQLYWFIIISIIILFLHFIGVHCGIYKSSYNVSNISYLNSPPPPLCFISSSPHSWRSNQTKMESLVLNATWSNWNIRDIDSRTDKFLLTKKKRDSSPPESVEGSLFCSLLKVAWNKLMLTNLFSYCFVSFLPPYKNQSLHDRISHFIL
jgi:hypothetical protein